MEDFFMFIRHLYIFLGEFMLKSLSYLFIRLLAFFLNCWVLLFLCTLWRVIVFYKIFWNILKIFSPGLWLVFSSWRHSNLQGGKKVFNLEKPSLSIISFTDYAFGAVSKKSSPYPRPSRFSPMLFTRHFIVLISNFNVWIIFSQFLYGSATH